MTDPGHVTCSARIAELEATLRTALGSLYYHTWLGETRDGCVRCMALADRIDALLEDKDVKHE